MYNEYFDNTFHWDESGNLHMFHRGSSRHFGKGYATNHMVHAVYTPEQIQQHIKDFGEHPLESHAKEYGPMQGILFNPYAGSGLKEDPDTSEDERRAIIRQAFQLGNTKQYAANQKQLNIKGTSPDKEAAMNLIEDTAYNSGIPNHIFKTLNNPAVLSNGVGIGRKDSIGKVTSTDFENAKYLKDLVALGESDSTDPNRQKGLVLRTQKVTNYVDVTARRRLDPIINPNYGNDITAAVTKKVKSGKNWRLDHLSRMNGELDDSVATVSGIPVSRPGYRDFPSSEWHKISAGSSGILFPGKGKETDEYFVQPFEITTHRVNSGHFGKTTFHIRYKKGAEIPHLTHTKIDPDNPVSERPIHISDTLVHETGHLVDPKADFTREHLGMGFTDMGTPDPVLEGTADGFADRHHGYQERWEDELTNSSRAREIAGTGYGLDRFKTDLHKAVYASLRLHTSLGEYNYKDLPHAYDFAQHIMVPHGDRVVSLSEAQKTDPMDKTLGSPTGRFGLNHSHYVKQYHQALLGHMYTHHAHVRSLLDDLGLAHEGKAAAKFYKTSVTDAGRPHPQEDEWPTLF